MKILSYLIITLCLFNSCSSENEKEKVTEELLTKENVEQVKKAKEKQSIIDGLVSKYNIHYMLDSVRFVYSIDYKPVIESKYQLIAKYYMNDIFQKDSIYYISIWEGLIKELTLTINKEQVNLLLSKETNKLLVISLKEVKKPKYFVDYDEVGSQENSIYFHAKGDLIEIVTLLK